QSLHYQLFQLVLTFELALALGVQMLILAGIVDNEETARLKLEEVLASGRALRCFEGWVKAQGGNPLITEEPTLLPKASIVCSVKCNLRGYVSAWDTEALGLAAMRLGAGRERKGDPIDHSVGLMIEKKIGDRMEPGEEIAQVYARSEQEATSAEQDVLAAIRISSLPVTPAPLILGYII
ncbi:MAG TPA: pyrimidine-nucleoside phosphorylase, partial [Firmicutes bacterium]|nr:pyrimidine-nucleoside phosphorylase [Bacillota bacterium]